MDIREELRKALAGAVASGGDRPLFVFVGDTHINIERGGAAFAVGGSNAPGYLERRRALLSNLPRYQFNDD